MGILNFAWGSHLDIGQFREIIRGEPLSARRAKLSGYALTANSLRRFPPEGAHLAGDGGGPRLVKQNGSSVFGVLYEIPQVQWDVLNQYEVAWGYEAFEWEVEMETGERVLARVHNLVEHGPFQPPSNNFLNTMQSGYRVLGYSEVILQDAMRAMTEPNELF